jgi:hypothetical protein
MVAILLCVSPGVAYFIQASIIAFSSAADGAADFASSAFEIPVRQAQAARIAMENSGFLMIPCPFFRAFARNDEESA